MATPHSRNITKALWTKLFPEIWVRVKRCNIFLFSYVQIFTLVYQSFDVFNWERMTRKFILVWKWVWFGLNYLFWLVKFKSCLIDQFASLTNCIFILLTFDRSSFTSCSLFIVILQWKFEPNHTTATAVFWSRETSRGSKEASK